jgi:hypothetical protein
MHQRFKYYQAAAKKVNQPAFFVHEIHFSVHSWPGLYFSLSYPTLF